MLQKLVLMIAPGLIVLFSLLLISGISIATVIGSTVTGLAFFALAFALLTEKAVVPSKLQKEDVEVEEM